MYIHLITYMHYIHVPGKYVLPVLLKKIFNTVFLTYAQNQLGFNTTYIRTCSSYFCLAL